MKLRRRPGARLVVAAVLLCFAAVRLIAPERANERMNESFLLLVAGAVLTLVLPWERLTSVKAAGVELGLELPQVQTAIQALGLDRLDDQHLHAELRRLEPELQLVRDSRVLWVDDRPARVLDVRRVLRAFGVDVVVVQSTREVEEALRNDGDFDLLVTNVQRRSPDELVTYAWLLERFAPSRREDNRFETADGRVFVAIHEGANYVVRLRLDESYPEPIRTLPVLFYSGFDWDRLVRFTREAVAAGPETDVARTPQTFVPRAIRMLAAARSERLAVVAAKAKA